MSTAGGNKLAVVLLNEEGDQLNASSIAQGQPGGRAAADELHRIARAEVASAGGGTGEAVVHLVTCTYAGSSSTKVAAQDKWLSGFGSSGQLCHLSLPLDDGRGAAGWILQLLTLYLPLAASAAPAAKITLVETVTVAPGVHDLVQSGLLKITSAFKGLFGEMSAAGSDDFQVEWTGVEELEKELAELSVEPEALVAECRPVSPPQQAHATIHPVSRPANTLFVARKRQTLFATDKLPPYPTTAFKCRIMRFDPDERPCNHFWLTANGCAHQGCTYRHDTPFTLEEFKAYRLWVKTTMCPDMSKLGYCRLDDAECPQGHRCPFTFEDCPHRQRGQCFYEEADLPHSEPATFGFRRW
ncbi:hypothetical protein JCM8208_006998 [Rhodotorula glutinis]